MRVIRPAAISNANTVTMTPPWWATSPGCPLTVRSRRLVSLNPWLAISIHARAIC